MDADAANMMANTMVKALREEVQRQQQQQRRWSKGEAILATMLWSAFMVLVVSGVLAAVFSIMTYVQQRRKDARNGKPYVAVFTNSLYDSSLPAGSGPVQRLVNAFLGRVPSSPHIVPMSIDSVLFVPATSANIAAAAQSAYDAGCRAFIGTLSSSELVAVSDFASKHPDTVFISTSSTAPSLNKTDNMFRLADSDDLMLAWLLPQLRVAMPGVTTLYTFADVQDEWAQQLQAAILAHSSAFGYSAVAQTTFDAVSPNPTVLNMVLFVDMPTAFATMLASKMPTAGCNIFLPDSAFGVPLDATSDAGKLLAQNQVISVSSFHADATLNAGSSVVGPTTPFVTNMLTALWMAYDCYQYSVNVSAATYPAAYLQQAQGVTGARYFNTYGNPASTDFMVSRLSAAQSFAGGKYLMWNAVTEAGSHPLLGDFATQYFTPPPAAAALMNGSSS